MRLDEANEDLAQMVALCCNNGYTIGVKFSKMGLIRVGETGGAFTVDDRVVRDFEQGMPLTTDRETDPVYELENSMEKIRIQTGA